MQPFGLFWHIGIFWPVGLIRCIVLGGNTFPLIYFLREKGYRISYFKSEHFIKESKREYCILSYVGFVVTYIPKQIVKITKVKHFPFKLQNYQN